MIGLTEKQQNVLNFIEDFIEDNGYSPTVKEIMIQFNFASPTAVTMHLGALEKKGYITKQGRLARSIVTLNTKQQKAKDTISIPLLGSAVKAGFNMIASDEDIEDTFTFSKSIVSDENSFLMRVKGDSMIDAHIEDNDLILVKPTADANNGDIIVAVVESDNGEEITVKRLFKEQTHVKLVAENKNYAPIIASDIRIIGKVTAVLRLFG